MGEDTRVRPLLNGTISGQDCYFRGKRKLSALIEETESESRRENGDGVRGSSSSVKRRTVGGNLCSLCKSLELRENEHGGFPKTSEYSGKYVEFPNSLLRLTLQRSDTLTRPPSISARMDAGCQFCLPLTSLLNNVFPHDLRTSTRSESITIKQLQYRWENGLRSLRVEFCSVRQNCVDEHRMEFPIEAYPGKVEMALLQASQF